ncbi:hypothetical protein CerSpe_002570 [Prunus speciosa]
MMIEESPLMAMITLPIIFFLAFYGISNLSLLIVYLILRFCRGGRHVDDLEAQLTNRRPSNLYHRAPYSNYHARYIAVVAEETPPPQASTVFTYITDQSFSTTTTAAAAECVICLDEFMEGQKCRLLANCNHSFHKPCIDEWLSTWKSRCPLCRAFVQNIS